VLKARATQKASIEERRTIATKIKTDGTMFEIGKEKVFSAYLSLDSDCFALKK